MLHYHAVYFPGEDGWVIAEVLDFPGVVTQGRTLRSARRMVRDALQLMAESLIEERQPLPQPNARAQRKTAIFREAIPLRVRVRVGANA